MTRLYTNRVSTRLASVVQQVVVAAVLLVIGVGTSAAGPKRARLSSDLDAMLKSGTAPSVDVIVSGSPERVAIIAQRHHLRVKKALTSGAVFEVSRQTLDAMSSDSDLEALSSDADVHSSSEITTAIHRSRSRVERECRSARRGERRRYRRRDYRQRHLDSPGAGRTSHGQR